MPSKSTKLIRDKIPALIPAQHRHLVKQSSGKQLLADKLMEESAELFEAIHAANRSELLNELADLTEVRNAIAKRAGISLDEIEAARKSKFDLRGGFESGFTLDQPFKEKNTRWFEGHDFTLLHFLQKLIPECKQIDLAVSFVMQSGLDVLENALIEATARGCRVRLLTTNYLDVTEPEALSRLLVLGNNLQLKMYDSRGRSFHPKTWLFRTNQDREIAIVGSSNLSRSALLTGVEWNYKVLDSDHGWPMQEAWQIFDQYFNAEESLNVDELLVAKYKENRRPKVLFDATPLASTIKPNAAQKEALVALAALREAGEKRAMVVAATGLGKTYLAAFDSEPYRRVLFVAHREELLIQAEKAFKAVRPNDTTHLLIRGAKFNAKANLVFASVQTLAGEKNQNLIPHAHFDYVVVDEFHRAAAKSYEALFDLDYSFLLGLTATPFRLDNKDLLALCDSNVAYQVNVIDAITLGWLCPFHYKGVYDATDYSKVDFRQGKYSLKSLTRALDNEVRNQLVLDEYLKTGSAQALGFCTSIRHSQSLADFFSKRGVKSISLSSESKREERGSAIERLTTGDVRVIFTVDLFNEGVDIPTVDLVMFLRPTESVTVFLQQLGRGLRLSEGKSHLNVIDMVGNYKGADFKLPTLIGLQDWNQRDLKKIADDLAADKLRDKLPGGIQIEMDALAIDAIRALNSQGLTGLMIEEYQRVKASLGRRPSMMEMLNNARYPIKLYRQRFGSWIEFVKDQGDLSESEQTALTPLENFIKEFEKAKMTKTYKAVVVKVFNELGGFQMAPTLAAIADGFRAHFMQARYKPELIGTEILRLEEVSDNQLIGYIIRNPINAWTNGADPYFEVVDDRFRYKGEVPSDMTIAGDWIDDLADFRIANHNLGRAKDEAHHKLIWGSNPGDKPHIILDRKNSDLPADSEFHAVRINGEKYLAKFVKIAINVIFEVGGSENALEELVRKSFPERTREALSQLRVRITPIPNDVGYEVEFY